MHAAKSKMPIAKAIADDAQFNPAPLSEFRKFSTDIYTTNFISVEHFLGKEEIRQAMRRSS
jgi:hypothetical protein